MVGVTKLVEAEKSQENSNVAPLSLNTPVASLPSSTDTNSMLDRADAVAKRMEEANKKAEELIQRQETVAARILLSGRAEAGTPMKTQEQTDKEKIDAEIKSALNRFR